eukprot:TRINITY_DN3747_c0_g1_i1.p1 TRINITY_DN3747_c0_g1~~TRINITY_DN3747_c0_g1_i1.p1  ORF type:complete len:367 (-),score=74.55 TRINITY_DN3747_c0_g1_i1:140-1240(-)
MEEGVDGGMLATLQGLGFEREVAVNALLITGNTSLDAALDYINSFVVSQGGGSGGSGGGGSGGAKTGGVPLPQNPQSLADFGYGYNDAGQLRDLAAGEPFKYLDQPHYEAMGEMIVKHIQKEMVDKYNMQEITIPLGVEGSNTPAAKSCVYVTKGALSSANALIVLVHGSGNVRAGQWARKPCFNDDLSIGSVLPFIQHAHLLNLGVVVLNPNLNGVRIEGRGVVDIRGNESPENHLLYVWDNILAGAKAQHIFFVSHSYGGIATINLLEKREAALLRRLRGIALTDSMHFFKHRALSRQALEFLATSCVDWVTSDQPLDTPVNNGADCICVSAGHLKHEHTSGSAIDSIFNFIVARLELQQQQQQ